MKKTEEIANRAGVNSQLRAKLAVLDMIFRMQSDGGGRVSITRRVV